MSPQLQYPVLVFDSNIGDYKKNLAEFDLYMTKEIIDKLQLKFTGFEIKEEGDYWIDTFKDIWKRITGEALNG